MATWEIVYDSIRDGRTYINGTVTTTRDSGSITDGEARTAVVEHHRANGANASHVWVMRTAEVGA